MRRVAVLLIFFSAAALAQDSPPSLIERQRQNLWTTRSAGIEIDAEAQLTPAVSLRASYLGTDAEVVDFAENRALEGKRLPQVPEQEASLAASYRSPRGIAAAAQVRYGGDQFEDDRNEMILGAFTTVDLFVDAPLSERIDLFAAVANLTDERVEIGRTPTVTLGAPRLARLGVRVRAPF